MRDLVSVVVRLVGTLDWQAEVLGLDVGKLGELGVDVAEVEEGDLLVEDLWEGVDTDVELLGRSRGVGASGLTGGAGELDVLLSELLVTGLVQHDLGKDLVGERAGHDEGRVAGSAAKVDETALGEKNDVAAGRHGEAVDLGLDVGHGLGVLLQPGNIDLNVKVADVADNGVLGHGLEVLANKNVTASSGGNEDLANGGNSVHGVDLVS